MTTLNGERMKAHIPGIMSKLRSVISGVPLSMSMEDVKKEMQGGKVIEVTRLQSKKEGLIKETLSVVIQFEESLPKSVQMGYISGNLSQIQLDVINAKEWDTQLSNVKVNRDVRDVVVSMSKKCEKDAKVKCCNCGGDHSAAYGGCIVQKEAKEVQRVKIMSTTEALKQVKEKGKYLQVKVTTEEAKIIQTKGIILSGGNP